MNRYLIRFVKYLVYFSLLILLLMAVVYYTSNHVEGLRFVDLIDPSRQIYFVIFIVALSAIYPLISFTTRKVGLNRAFEQDKAVLCGVIEDCKYTIVEDNSDKIVFRPTSTFVRVSRLFEDKIEMTWADDILEIKGMRRDVDRFARRMEYISRMQEKEE